MTKTTRLALVALVLLLAGAGVAVGQSTNYVIGPQDVLAITVWDEPGATGKFTVEADGTFTFPMIGRVKAGGLTLRELEAELVKRLKPDFLKNPQVSVAVEQYRSQRVFVNGEVRTPGTYPLTGDMTLIEVLARAGSTTPTAGGEAIIVHPKAGQQVDGPTTPDATNGNDQVRVDLKDLERGQLANNIQLRDGDSIWVLRAETIFVSGQVKSPGEYAVKKGTTVLQAISLAGGATDRGATNRVKILRIVEGEQQEIRVKLADLVQPGDTIVVPERYF